MSRYQAYPEYKGSGLQWLGKMPSHWFLRKSKYVFSRVQREVRPEDGVVTAFRDGQVTLRSNRRMDGFTESIKEIGYQGVRKGDLLVHAMDGFAGAIGVSDSDGKCSPVCSVCVPTDSEKIHISYFGYLVRQLAVTDFISSLAKGIRERSTEFRYSEFSVLDLALPPQNEQVKIATFLDYETAKIDALIEKQQRLIELLKEKRQAVISHAVTKGLNPNAPMKDSGVEWLGEVPAHWSIKKLGYLANKIGSGKTPKGGSEIYQDDGVLFLRSQNIYDSGLRLDPVDCVYISNSIHEEMAGTKVQAGDVLLNITGGSIGRSCLVPADFSTANVNQHVCILRFPSGANEFLAFLIKSQTIQAQIDACQTGGNREGLNFEQISKMAICLPPNDEQIQIVEHLNTSTRKFDHLELTALQTVALLQERRTALISAAVTGKIDVRDWQAAA
jgi:type I restriction enzyme S subunit